MCLPNTCYYLAMVMGLFDVCSCACVSPSDADDLSKVFPMSCSQKTKLFFREYMDKGFLRKLLEATVYSESSS